MSMGHMRWVCPKCGRFYNREQIQSIFSPRCFFCGTPLKPWMENSNWVFFLTGLILLPLIGYFAVSCTKILGLNSPQINMLAYFIFPSALLSINLLEYYVGHMQGNPMLKRGSEQGLLMVIGFAVSTCILWMTDYYCDIMGIF